MPGIGIMQKGHCLFTTVHLSPIKKGARFAGNSNHAAVAVDGTSLAPY